MDLSYFKAIDDRGGVGLKNSCWAHLKDLQEGEQILFMECQNQFLFKSYRILKLAILVGSFIKQRTKTDILRYITQNVSAPSIFVQIS